MKQEETAPTWLKATARDYWSRVAPYLHAEGILNPATRDLIAVACHAYECYRKSTALLEKEGYVITSKTGATKCNPRLQVQKQAFEQWVRVWKELGVSEESVPVPQNEIDAAIAKRVNG